MLSNKEKSAIRDDILIERMESLIPSSLSRDCVRRCSKSPTCLASKIYRTASSTSLQKSTTIEPWWSQPIRSSGTSVISTIAISTLTRSLKLQRRASRQSIGVQFLGSAPAIRAFFDDAQKFGVGSQGLTLPIRGRLGEVALFSVTSDERDETWDLFVKTNVSYLLIFAWNFHNRVLRILGVSPSRPSPCLTGRRRACA